MSSCRPGLGGTADRPSLTSSVHFLMPDNGEIPTSVQPDSTNASEGKDSESIKY